MRGVNDQLRMVRRRAILVSLSPLSQTKSRFAHLCGRFICPCPRPRARARALCRTTRTCICGDANPEWGGRAARSSKVFNGCPSPLPSPLLPSRIPRSLSQCPDPKLSDIIALVSQLRSNILQCAVSTILDPRTATTTTAFKGTQTTGGRGRAGARERRRGVRPDMPPTDLRRKRRK